MQTVCCETFGPPETLQRIEIETPNPGPGEVLVQIHAAGVGFVDGLMVQGLYQVKPPLPYYPGSEFAGVVVDIGPGVEGVEIGARVLGLAPQGAFSDALLSRADRLVMLPDNVSMASAASLYINYATALYGLRDQGCLQAGETVLVLGAAGGVGSAAICVAKAMGAHVIGAASSSTKRGAALEFGADEVVDYSAADWRDQLKALAPEGGIDLVYDPVGGDFAETAFRSLLPGGRFLVVGFASGAIPKLPLNLALLKRASVVGVDWGGESRANPQINQELLGTIMSWIATEKLRTAHVTTRQMESFRQALEDQLAGRIVGKLVLENQS